MVRLRLQRIGNKNRPYYRIVAADQRSPRDGRFIEILGTYNPAKTTGDITLKNERLKYWLGTGAQPSPTVKNILSKNGLLTAAKA